VPALDKFSYAPFLIRKDDGREHANVIMNIPQNVVAGQVTGDTAKQLSERYGILIQTS